MKKLKKTTRQQLLRWRSNLVVSGMGVIALGIWTDVKAMLNAFLQLGDLLEEVSEDVPVWLTVLLAVIIIVIFMMILLLPRLYVGLSAIAEGRGRKRRNGYMILAGILAALNSFEIVHIALNLADAERPLIQEIAILVIDLTLVITLIDLISSASKVRKLREASKEGEMACS